MSHPIENIMHSSMEHIKALADVNTVIGDAMLTDDDTMILPVSKVSLGLMVGGGEYLAGAQSKKNAPEPCEGGGYPFIGASTVGMCLTPLAFLAVRSDGVRVLPAKQECPSDRLIDLIPKAIDTAERLLRELMGKCSEGSDCRCKKDNAAGKKQENDAENACSRGEERKDFEDEA